MKLILVEDNINFKDDLKFFLENKLIHTVIGEATSGEEFLALLNINDADIILMDLSLEKMNGVDTAKKILFQFPCLKIIAMTMSTEHMVILNLQEAGFKGCILKTEIFRSLENVLQSVYSDQYLFSDKFWQIKN